MTKLYDYLRRKIEASESDKPFDPEPFAEEGLMLLQYFQDQIHKLRHDKMMLEFDVQAEKRNVDYLKNRRTGSTA